MGAKKVIGAVIAVVVVILAVTRLGRESTPKSEPLRIYTWSNYFSDRMLAEFTKRTGIKVELSYMSSNEELFAKLRAGATGFDIIQPSDYMVRQMAKLQMLHPLEHAELPNLSHLDDSYRNLPYDPGQKFSVPFTWGTTGIAVNVEKVPVPAEGVSWKWLLESPDPKHTSALDDMREVFASMLRLRDQSINTTDPAALAQARADIAEMKNRILLFSSEPKALLLKGELNVSHIYSCDAAQATQENPKIRYFVPKEGGTLWTDNFAIPKGSKNPKAAHAFINFVLDPDVAVEIVREKSLATPNKTAKAKLTDAERNDPAIYPSKEVLDRMQFLEDLGETLQVVNRMWTELKS